LSKAQFDHMLSGSISCLSRPFSTKTRWRQCRCDWSGCKQAMVLDLVDC